MPGTPNIQVVLFDLGGVLIDVGGVPPMKALARIDSDEEMWQRWLTCRWVRSFEQGECSADDFAAGVVDDWALDVEPAVFLDAFRTWPGAPLPGADELVADVRASVAVGCLSNTNAMHTDDQFSKYEIFESFDYRFLSYQLGLVKPDRALFDRVAELVPVAPERVAFLDDNLMNVEGAVEAGFVARHVRGVDEARAALVALEVVGD
jgi:HAD superfamily hydrolase (TIGR01509 family)